MKKNSTIYFVQMISFIAIPKLSPLILHIIFYRRTNLYLYIVCGKQASNRKSKTSSIYKTQVALFRSKYCNWAFLTLVCGVNFSNASTEP
jgi:hypothetical protein